jgi:hypothetical protein
MPLVSVSGPIQAFTLFTVLFCTGTAVVGTFIIRRRQREWDETVRRGRPKRPK